VGKRNRRREKIAAPASSYTGPDGEVLVLRGSLTPATRKAYAEVLSGGLEREDAWQRGVEFLFERLALSWEISGVGFERQKELLGRFRMASADERRFVRDALREHLAEHFPDMQAP
jgi:hypothetical protein